MDRGIRWVVGIVIAVAIVALIAFARGTPEHAEPTAPPSAAVAVSI
jgi:hypothetical protein